jgi:hypothetical protein
MGFWSKGQSFRVMGLWFIIPCFREWGFRVWTPWIKDREWETGDKSASTGYNGEATGAGEATECRDFCSHNMTKR